jgi:hypothetical protein
MIQELEQAIAHQLLPLEQQGVRILNTPQSVKAQFAAQALVFWGGLSSDSSSNIQPVQQKDTHRFVINLQLEDMRSQQPIYPMIERIRELLTGFNPGGTHYRTGTLSMQSADYVSYKEAVWLYSLNFSLSAIYMHRKTINNNPHIATNYV